MNSTQRSAEYAFHNYQGGAAGPALAPPLSLGRPARRAPGRSRETPPDYRYAHPARRPGRSFPAGSRSRRTRRLVNAVRGAQDHNGRCPQRCAPQYPPLAEVPSIRGESGRTEPLSVVDWIRSHRARGCWVQRHPCRTSSTCSAPYLCPRLGLARPICPAQRRLPSMIDAGQAQARAHKRARPPQRQLPAAKRSATERQRFRLVVRT
jgi:hypothetical protein